MQIYICGKFEEKELVQEYMTEAEKLGHTITHDWTRNSIGYCTEDAENDLDGVLAADAVVAIAQNKHEYKGLYCEIGAALVLGIPVYIIGNNADACVFSLLCKKINDLTEITE